MNQNLSLVPAKPDDYIAYANDLVVIEDEFDAVDFDNEGSEAVKTFESVTRHDQFNDISISDNSHKNHIGTKLFAHNINIINKHSRTESINPKLENTINVLKYTKKKIFIIELIAFFILFIVLTIVVVEITKFSRATIEPTKPTTQSTKPSIHPTEHTTLTKSTTQSTITTIHPAKPTTLPTTYTTTVEPPVDWLVNKTTWSGHPSKRISNYLYSTISIDNLPGKRCFSKPECTNLLNSTEIGMDFNFLISDDGIAYEITGWFCLYNISLDKSTDTIKIGFIGNYSERYDNLSNNQLNTFDKLVQYGIKNQHIEKDYIILPQCCRKIANENGPDKNVLTYIYSSNRFHSPHLCDHLCHLLP